MLKKERTARFVVSVGEVRKWGQLKRGVSTADALFLKATSPIRFPSNTSLIGNPTPLVFSNLDARLTSWPAATAYGVESTGGMKAVADRGTKLCH